METPPICLATLDKRSSHVSVASGLVNEAGTSNES